MEPDHGLPTAVCVGEGGPEGGRHRPGWNGGGRCCCRHQRDGGGGSCVYAVDDMFMVWIVCLYDVGHVFVCGGSHVYIMWMVCLYDVGFVFI